MSVLFLAVVSGEGGRGQISYRQAEGSLASVARHVHLCEVASRTGSR